MATTLGTGKPFAEDVASARGTLVEGKLASALRTV